MDLWSVDIRRFGPHANNRSFLGERVTEVLGLHYQMAWPNREYTTGRGLRKSPLHDRLAALGACFGSKNGWERPNWFASGGMEPVVSYSFGRQNWFECSACEHRAARQAVALFDQSGFSKFTFKGRDAVKVLQRLCANNVDVPIGKVVYTALLNERGGFESDLTVVRLDEQEYYLVSGTAQTVRDQDWITRHIHPEEDATLHDITEAFSVLGIMGPNARVLLQRIADADLANSSFPFATAQTIDIGQATVRALRITYVGELGWELHVPTSQAVALFDTLMEAGRDLGLRNAGHYALNSLRLEKGYRAWGSDLGTDDTPLEAGLEFAIAWTKACSFLGRDALLRQKEAGLARQLMLFVLKDPEPMLWGGEPIVRDGTVVGFTTSGAYGHSVGGAVAMGYVKRPVGDSPAPINKGQYEINIAGKCYAAQAYSRAPYDPDRRKILA
jgi:4-methylaminobutanoate oxidase (formaldehyde-forming)